MSDDALIGDFSAVAEKLSPETKSAFTDQMVRAGHDRSWVEAALNVVTPLQQAQLPAPSTAVEFQQPGLTPEQTAKAVQNLREHWSGDRGELETALKRLGVADAKVATPEPKSALAERGIDIALSPPSDGNYNLNFGERAGLVAADELAALNGELNTAFRSAEIPANLAQPITDALLDSAGAMDGLNETQTQLYQREQKAMLGKLGNADELLRLAAVGLVGIPSETVQMLRENGCFESAQAIAQLAAAGRAREYRERRAAS